MLKNGTKAPAFTLPDAEGTPVSLTELIADGPLVLYFYPADFTPGCTKEACAIRDMHDDLLASGLRIVGVSPQDADSHVRFASRHELPFPLLSDEDKRVIRDYDLDGPLGFGVRRGTYLIDTDGTIVDGVLADIAIGRHVEFIERAMRAQG